MYSSQSFDEKGTTRMRNEDYDLCRTGEGNKFIVQWSPQNGARYLSRNRYASPQSLSKLAPRRNRTIVRCNINRSLNFDIGMHSRKDSFKSPNSSSDSNVSVDNDSYLSRSAKILRALNIDYSPLYSTGVGICKVNKSLNSDPSPSSQSRANLKQNTSSISTKCLVSPLSKISKTLHFETSSGESSVISRHDSSVESIDENQNQTPSQRNKKAKKSLNYSSPKSGSKNRDSSNTRDYSPMLRSELKEKINDIIQSNMTPNLQSSKRNLIINKFNDFGGSTPRNLFNDFCDNDEEDKVVDNQDNGRPQTPENLVHIIPESMSAIKKSHKKERVLGRLGKAIEHPAEICSGSEFFTDMAIDKKSEENRSTRPPFASAQYNSPQCGVNLIKQSFREKSESKSYVDNSEDRMSETGSIFDYTSEAKAISEFHNSSKRNRNAEGTNIPEPRDSHLFEEDCQKNPPLSDKVSTAAVNAFLGEDGSLVISSLKVMKPTDQLEVVREVSVVNPLAVQTTSIRPTTPENHANFLHRIMTDSIKKSHKKIKDTNKKLLFKPRTIQNDVEEVKNIIPSVSEDNPSRKDGDRAATPENTNSSRLLLLQFSSVKKSHRKDKHRRMRPGSSQRKKFFVRDGEAVSNSDCEIENYSGSSSISDFPSLSSGAMSSDSVKPPGATAGWFQDANSNEFSSSVYSGDGHSHSLEPYPLDDNTCEMGIDALPNSDCHKSSPNKRKNVSNDSLIHAISQSPTKQGFISVSDESAEEEFKIFTPIKKRRSFNLVTPIARRICDNNNLLSANGKLSEGALIENANTRCSTPTTAGGSCWKLIENRFKTPDKNVTDIFIAITDYSTPTRQEKDNAINNSSCGRSTPQNQSTAVLMVGINSIKKSHKKDKRGNASRRFLICAQEKENESEFTSSLENHPSKSLQLRDSARPSTSYENANECAIIEPKNEMDEQAKTPPNSLQAKNYLRLLQTESIKSSHKKVRGCKMYRSIVVDSELSDNGSIFDETERRFDVQNEGLGESENEKRRNTDQAYLSQHCSSETNVIPTSYTGHDWHFQGSASSRYNGTLSDDGSIFDSKEKSASPCKNDNGIERADNSLV